MKKKQKMERAKAKKEGGQDDNNDKVDDDDEGGKDLEGDGEGQGADAGFNIYSIHGKIPHKRRLEVYEKFCKSVADKKGRAEASGGGGGDGEERGACLLTTDLAARGLDIPNVHIIVQFSPPQVRLRFWPLIVFLKI